MREIPGDEKEVFGAMVSLTLTASPMSEEKESIIKNTSDEELESVSGGTEETFRSRRIREIKDREPRQRILRRR